jgi:TetR/AcrR family transcriptional regulator, repressor for neighboring sulfatase
MSDAQTPIPVPRGRPPKDATAPRGREQVYAATIEAATSLFADRGIAAVSVREVATRAGVNPALVHRYVGGKPVLVRAVIMSLTDRMRGDLDTFASNVIPVLPRSPEQTLATYQRIAAHIVIEGGDIRDYQTDFPVIRHIIEEIQVRTGVDARTARRRGAQIFALDLAVRLFEPVLMRAAGLEPGDADDLHRRVRQLLVAIGDEA